eukprot:UN27972
MPWPFTTYKQPAAAKKWLSKYPAQAPSNFEDEFVYLDEIEDRIAAHHRTQRVSDRYREAQNQYAVIGDNDDVDKLYPSLGEGPEKHYGRGNLINPAHYIGPQFLLGHRPMINNQKVKNNQKELLKSGGELGPAMMLPPETPSIFKFWNFLAYVHGHRNRARWKRIFHNVESRYVALYAILQSIFLVWRNIDRLVFMVAST